MRIYNRPRTGLICMVCATLLLALVITAGANSLNKGSKALAEWRAGSTVSKADVAAYGTDKCFMADTISDKVFARMLGKSYKRNCTVERKRLRYLRVLHHDGKGNIVLGEMVCNSNIADDLTDIFRKLYEAGYPIERMVLIDNYDADDERSMEANNSSCFNFRKKTNPAAGLSKHALGMAIDINPLYNPYLKRRKDGTSVVKPAKGRPYTDRQKSFKYKISKGDLCHRLFIEHGFRWGGSWKSAKDYQHFEK